MTEIGASSVHASFAILRATLSDYRDEETEHVPDVEAILRNLAERHGSRGVALAVHMLAVQTLGALERGMREIPGYTLEEYLERQEVRFLNLEAEGDG